MFEPGQHVTSLVYFVGTDLTHLDPLEEPHEVDEHVLVKAPELALRSPFG
jgi:hypothetical protein